MFLGFVDRSGTTYNMMEVEGGATGGPEGGWRDSKELYTSLFIFQRTKDLILMDLAL